MAGEWCVASLTRFFLGAAATMTDRPAIGRWADRVLSRKMRIVLVFLLPALAIYTVFIAYPYITSIIYSFTDWIGVGERNFIGFDNYVRLFTEPRMSGRWWNAFKHNAILFGVSMLFTVGLGLTFALLLSNRKLKGRGFFKVAYFMPYILPPLTAGFVWRYILHPRIGVVNEIFRTAIPWLGKLDTAFPTVVIVWCLRVTGLYILFFLASILSISNEYRDAARVDGCNRLKEIWYIDLPLLRPTILMITLLNFINAFGAFDMFYALTGIDGAPFGRTDVLTTFFYRTAFGTVNQPFGEGLGMGSAVACSIAVFVIAVSLVFLRLIHRTPVEY